MPRSRILINTPATISATFYDGGESAVDPGTVTVTILRADGTALVTNAATSGGGAAARTYDLAAQTSLDNLTAVWTGSVGGRKVTTYHEIVGGFYASLAEIRALDALSNTSKYPTAKLEAARMQAEDRFEDATGVAWVPRYYRETLVGDNTTTLLLTWPKPRTVTAVSIDGTAASDLTLFSLYPTGVIERKSDVRWPVGSTSTGNVVVAYTHGYDQPSEDIRQAFLTYVRYLVLDTTSRIPDRASSYSTDFGTFQLVTAGFKRPTGLPEVDAVLNDHDHSVAGIGAV